MFSVFNLLSAINLSTFFLLPRRIFLGYNLSQGNQTDESTNSLKHCCLSRGEIKKLLKNGWFMKIIDFMNTRCLWFSVFARENFISFAAFAIKFLVVEFWHGVLNEKSLLLYHSSVDSSHLSLGYKALNLSFGTHRQLFHRVYSTDRSHNNA